ncbi:hypothetical protein IV203_008085 [Nitzschia inconspicua]|uniref:DUF5672 domain-containing protein n=1 Tax=Nitzschia inconspicua TaxID=303405 RepID=A0A9K3KY42_9STRA|nr:hypothetical protein IV203_008085 [Nitzschia inconspicua]
MTILLKRDVTGNHKKNSRRRSVRLLASVVAISLLVILQFPSVSLFDYASDVSFESTEARSEQRSSLSHSQQLNFTLQPFYQNPTILKKNCSVTVLFVDPNLGKDSMWALESVVANILPLETTCVLLQTSVCEFISSTDGHIDAVTGTIAIQQASNKTELYNYNRKAQQVRQLAEPLFGKMIDRGNVRMKVLNHSRYNLKSCHNFYNPSHLLENYHFWGPDEFLPEDSDLILMMQGDAVLCHELNVDKWKDVAWVGAPWPARKGKKPWHFCSFFPQSWKEFHEHAGSTNIPTFPTDDQLCTDTSFGPQGNGGLGLRSRSWLRKSIEYCPVVSRTISGLSQQQYDAAPCKATNVAAEDIYFVTILRGIGAPLPNNFEAALFSMELRSPNAIAEQYSLNQTFMEAMVQRRWYSPTDPSGMEYYKTMLQQGQNLSSQGIDPLIPIGVHKPWNDFLRKRILEDYLNDQCPYMKHVVECSKYGRKHIEEMKAAAK